MNENDNTNQHHQKNDRIDDEIAIFKGLNSKFIPVFKTLQKFRPKIPFIFDSDSDLQ